DLAKAGWGVIFAQNYTNYTLEALQSDDGLGLLLAHRQRQASLNRSDYYKEFVFDPKWDKNQFLAKQGAPISGAVDPDRGVPYYLLIVGNPATIPYEFQYQLDVQYAVGRIYFDTLDEYAYYAQSVVRAEVESIERSRQISFWSVSNRGDKATQLSTKYLVAPLSQWLTNTYPDWATSLLMGENETAPELSATKANLDRLLNQEPAPALLFTASHGVGYPKGHPEQRDYQGAFITQDWEQFLGKPDPDQHLFGAADIQANANLHGMIAFHFACYGLGTPQFNDFKHRDGEAELAEQPFVARLPQKLLSHEKGGALAVIGHIDRAWTHSFKNSQIKQWAVFQSALTCLIRRCPVGYAMEYFNQEYAELASDCNLGIQNDKKKDKEIAELWTRSHNARNFAIFGDPAVRVAISQSSPQSTDEVKPIIWFKPSGIPSQPPINSTVAVQRSEPISKESDRLIQLENQVKTLQTEVTSLQAAMDILKQKLDRIEGTGQ
ncbi:C25 family cysteine peptidase, partial [Trichocoleus desertorum AS-A10]|uniref:C25 family cysteine peptidase n=1 Tax=Trichocoleus desertorum TaxID=1481672 RepID=UPI00329A55BC